MSSCPVQTSGSIELFFYGELDAAEHASIEQHVAACNECRRALEDLELIQAALAARPDVSAPAGGDWSGFMSRLQASMESEPFARHRPALRWRSTSVAALAIAALVILATLSVAYVANVTIRRGAQRQIPVGAGGPPALVQPQQEATESAFASLTEQHFDRSKLVVLGLANKNARAGDADWDYERQLAAALLSDTRLYRLAAEQRGMQSVAGVMGDLELVLLQTSLSAGVDPNELEQIQSLIRKRDLVTKMTVVTTVAGM